jgi:hypothetical protein
MMGESTQDIFIFIRMSTREFQLLVPNERQCCVRDFRIPPHKATKKTNKERSMAAFDIDYVGENEKEQVKKEPVLTIDTPHPLILYHSKAWKINVDTSYPLQEVFNQKVNFMCEGLTNGTYLSLDVIQGNERIGCGTTLNPDIETLLRMATPSKFGKGMDTVYDENIRKGLEILPDQLVVSPIHYGISENLCENLFKTGSVSFNFSKMAIYQAGGHFDIHRDHVQNADHQGTLLIEVRSEHTGGDLVLSHQGVEYRWSLTDTPSNANSIFNRRDNTLRYVAFFTDMIHRVEPVMSGVRIVLQYDILVRPSVFGDYRKNQWGISSTNNKWDISSTKYYSSPITDRFTSKLFGSLQTIICDDSHGAALPLFHLYPDSQLTPNRLKMKDMHLFSFLIEQGYCVQLTPIVITNKQDYREYEDHDEDDEDAPRRDDFVPGYSVREASIIEIGYVLSQDQQLGQGETDMGTVGLKAYPILDRPSKITYLATGYEQAMYLDTIQHGYYGNEAETSESKYFCVAFVITTPKAITKKIPSLK